MEEDDGVDKFNILKYLLEKFMVVLRSKKILDVEN